MTEYDEAVLRLWLTGLEGIGLKTQKILLSAFNDISEIYEASHESLSKVIVSEKADIISKNKSLSRSKELYEIYSERNIKIIYPGHKHYSGKLLHIYDYPEILFVRGKPEHINKRCIAVVGSRNPSVYGREAALYFSRELSKKNLCIVSGLARGIDSAAHRGALTGAGKTIAVLGCGINVTYPRENAELYAEIEREGVIISEYGLNVSPEPGLFPMRNRIISGLSDGVLVVEARKRSGSLITSDYALEQGRQVYAVPGRAFDAASEGTNNLIKQGALCVTDISDILSDIFGIGQEEKSDKDKNITLSDREQKIYDCLSLEPVFIDDIIAKTGYQVTDTISLLYGLCDRKLIKQPFTGYYIKTIC